MPFRLTSACRYVLVFKDNVVDLETVCGNSPQNWASPEDWCWDACWPCHNSLVSTPRPSSPRHTCSPTTIGSRIPFLQDNQDMPVFCHRHDLSNLTHFLRKQSYIDTSHVYKSWTYVLPPSVLRTERCCTMFCLGLKVIHVFQFLWSTPTCRNLTGSTSPIKQLTDVLILFNYIQMQTNLLKNTQLVYVIFHVCQVLSQLYTHTTVSD